MVMINGRTQLLTPTEVSRLLHIHINTVRRWSDQGILKPYRIGARGDRRFDKDQILYFLQNNNTPDNNMRKSDVPGSAV
jgi:excisionase family DNA binding protein